MAANRAKAPAAFLSYAHRDDRYGDITRLRERLAHAVSVALGQDFEIFQDREDIAWGQHWPGQLDEALEWAVFLIPILSPSFFASPHCRAELEKFLELERRTGRRDLILPIYLRTAHLFEDRSDPLAALLRERQYRDWRDFRHKPIDAPEVIQRLDQLADELEAAIRRPASAQKVEPAPLPEDIAEGPPVHPPAAERPSDLEPIEEERRVVRNVALRANPSLAAQIVTRLKAGAVVYVAGRARDSGWLRIDEDELRGYVVADAVEAQWRSPNGPDVWGQGPQGETSRPTGRRPMVLEPPTEDEKSARAKALAAARKRAEEEARRRAEEQATRPLTEEMERQRREEVERPQAGREPKKQQLAAGKAATATAGEAPLHAEREQRATAVRSARRRGELFRDIEAPWCPELVVIPAGRFLMGSPEDEEGRFGGEGPQHEVVIGAPFALGRYPVTFEEYDAFSTTRQQVKPGDQGRSRWPMVHVSWDDAQAYAAWLRKRTGRPYRLPSEAEWEYACRAGTMTPFWTGMTISTAQANYNGSYSYGSGRKGECRGQTTPVDAFPPNPWGLHDTHGNVWEWCADRWHEDYGGAPTDGSAWLEGTSSAHVLRGGSWSNDPRHLRSAYRSKNVVGIRIGNLGFRVARTLTP